MKKFVSVWAAVGATALLGACMCGPLSHHGRGGGPGAAGRSTQHRCGCRHCTCAAEQAAPAERPCEKPCPMEKSAQP